MLKKCFFCGSKNVVRNGLRGRKQLYKRLQHFKCTAHITLKCTACSALE